MVSLSEARIKFSKDNEDDESLVHPSGTWLGPIRGEAARAASVSSPKPPSARQRGDAVTNASAPSSKLLPTKKMVLVSPACAASTPDPIMQPPRKWGSATPSAAPASDPTSPPPWKKGGAAPSTTPASNLKPPLPPSNRGDASMSAPDPIPPPPRKRGGC